MHFIDDFDLWEFVKEKKAEGIIRHIGISFHSTPGELETILQTHPEAEFVQLQINYADWEEPSIQSRSVYEMARKYGKRVVIMEPLKGGLLANPSETVANVLKSADPDLSYASWGIRFAADLDGVLVALSGMSDLAQMEDNISYMKDFTGLTEEQSTVIDRARKELEKIPLIPCTSCNYCAKVCPKENGISGTFTAKNIYALYGNKAIAAGRERWLVGGHGRQQAVNCIRYGQCEKVCPQHIHIQDELEEAAALFGQEKEEQKTGTIHKKTRI